MILTLAIEPFFQQVIQYQGCAQPQPNSFAGVPGASNYTTYGDRLGPGAYQVENAMGAAISIGLINPPANASTLLTPQCVTGNCTFSEDDGASFSTTAMCYSCSDITDRIENKSDKSDRTITGYKYTLDNLALTYNTALSTEVGGSTLSMIMRPPPI